MKCLILFSFILSAPLYAKTIPTAKVETKTAAHQTPVQELFKILAGKSTTKFKVSECDQNKLEWVKLVLSNGSRPLNYAFNKECDVEGSFVAKINSPIPMKLKLRHLSNFTYADMTVIVQIKMSMENLTIRFETPKGLMVSPVEKITYKGFYSVVIDFLTGRPLPGSGKGEVTILKINDKVVNLRAPIKDV